eukprot:Awhi_evm1s1500
MFIRNKVKKYNKLKKSAGFRRRTVQNKKLLRDMDIDIKTSVNISNAGDSFVLVSQIKLMLRNSGRSFKK